MNNSYHKMPYLSPNMLAMLVYLKRRRYAVELDKRTLKALVKRKLVYFRGKDAIHLSTLGREMSKLARYYS